MALNRWRSRHSRGWWVVILCACLAMGMYIAFDLLDLDGSNRHDLGRGTALAAETTPAEVERYLQRGSAAEEAGGLILPPMAVVLSSDSHRFTVTTLSVFGGRQGHIHPKTLPGRESSFADSPTEDPA